MPRDYDLPANLDLYVHCQSRPILSPLPGGIVCKYIAL